MPLPVSRPSRARLPTLSAPPSVNVPGAATVTAAPSDSRLAAPSVRLPLLTVTTPAVVTAFNVLLPVDVSTSATSGRSRRPPSIDKPVTRNVPLPLMRPASERLSSVWSPASVSVPAASTAAELVAARRPLPSRRSVPSLTVVVPVKRFWPLSVTVPVLDLLAPCVPPSMADTEPLCRSKVAVLVSTPVLPATVPPPCSDSDATVSLWPPMSKVALFTVSALALPITSLAPSASVPPVISVAPV